MNEIKKMVLFMRGSKLGAISQSATLTREPTLLQQTDGFRLLEIDCGERRFLIAERTSS